jgi:pSer/pThr/pTyr-binding forkhead associated (FHA) protein
MAAAKLLRIRVSLKGRPVKSFTFKKENIKVGRNPESDIFLDNPGISREHFKIELNARGYYEVEDLGSANGTYLNDELIQREPLMNNDVIRAGKFSLWVNYEEDRRGSPGGGAGSPTAYEGTTVLSTTELEELMVKAREADSQTPETWPAEHEETPTDRTPGAAPRRTVWVATVAAAFVLGGFVGAGVVWLLLG